MKRLWVRQLRVYDDNFYDISKVTRISDGKNVQIVLHKMGWISVPIEMTLEYKSSFNSILNISPPFMIELLIWILRKQNVKRCSILSFFLRRIHCFDWVRENIHLRRILDSNDCEKKRNETFWVFPITKPVNKFFFYRERRTSHCFKFKVSSLCREL